MSFLTLVCGLTILFAIGFLDGLLKDGLILIAVFALILEATDKSKEDYGKFTKKIKEHIEIRLAHKFKEERENASKNFECNELVCKRITVRGDEGYEGNYVTLNPSAILFNDSYVTTVGMGQKGISTDRIFIDDDSLTIKDTFPHEAKAEKDVLVRLSPHGIFVDDYLNGEFIIETHVSKKTADRIMGTRYQQRRRQNNRDINIGDS